MPIGSKTCDICSTYGAATPVQQPQAWVAPAEAAAPVELASSAASWSGGYDNRPGKPAELQKARKQVRRAARIFAIVGGLSVALGLAAEVFDWTSVLGLINWYTVAEGSIFLVLAFFAGKGSLVAVAAGAALYFLDSIALLFSGHFSVVRLLILAVLVRAVLAANMLRQQGQTATAGNDQTRAA